MGETLGTLAPFYVLRPDYLLRHWPLGRGRAVPVSEPLQAILAHYDLRLQEPVQALANPGRSESLILHTQAGRKIVKRYKPSVDVAAVTHEHSLLRHLAQINFPAPRLWPTTDGATFVQHGSHCYALFDWLEGTFQYHHYLLLPGQTKRFIAAAGQALSHLHQALAGFIPEGRNMNGFPSLTGERWRDVDWCLDQLQTCRHVSAPDKQPLERFLNQHGDWLEARFHTLKNTLKDEALSRVMIHGDYGPYNLLFHRHNPAVIIDFELARLDWRLSDLAKALPMFARSRFGFSLSKAAAFLNGYWQTCPHPSTEMIYLLSVWEFLLLRRVVACCGQYAQTGATHCLPEAEHKLADVHWLQQSAQARALLTL